MGLRIERLNVPAPTCEVWLDHATALAVFSRCSTQWNVGLSGATGLRYEAIPVLMDLLEVPKSERLEVFECVRTMELHTLELMAASR